MAEIEPNDILEADEVSSLGSLMEPTAIPEAYDLTDLTDCISQSETVAKLYEVSSLDSRDHKAAV